MLKKLVTLAALLYAVASFATVELNKATAAQIDELQGVGPGLSSRILDERIKGEFKNWNDFIARVRGLDDKSAATFSAQGMTINGKAFKGLAAANSRAQSDR